MDSIVVGVLGLATPDGPLSLPNGAVLRGATEAELAEYYFDIPRTAWSENAFVFVPPQNEAANSIIDKIEIILQLTTDAAIGLWAYRQGGAVTQPARPTNVGLYHYSRDTGYRPASPPTLSEVQRWTDLWNSLPSRAAVETETRIRRAVQRYQRALEEGDEEAIFFLVCACEALVSPEHRENKRRSRFIARVSKLAAARTSQRDKIKHSLTSFWRRRSGFAHGDHSEQDEHPNVLRSYAHTVIRSALESPARFAANKVQNLG
jgi:Apea-like HEPN